MLFVMGKHITGKNLKEVIKYNCKLIFEHFSGVLCHMVLMVHSIELH